MQKNGGVDCATNLTKVAAVDGIVLGAVINPKIK